MADAEPEVPLPAEEGAADGAPAPEEPPAESPTPEGAVEGDAAAAPEGDAAPAEGEVADQAPPAEEGATVDEQAAAGDAEGDEAAPTAEAALAAEAAGERGEEADADAAGEVHDKMMSDAVAQAGEADAPSPGDAAAVEADESPTNVGEAEMRLVDADAPPSPGGEEEVDLDTDPLADLQPEAAVVLNEPDPSIALQARLEELHEKMEGLQRDNLALQKRVISQKASRGADKLVTDSSKITEHKYLNVLSHVHQIRLKLRQQQLRAARISDELRFKLEEKRAKAMECRDSFRNFKREVGQHAEYTRTGQKIPARIISEIEAFELEKDAEVEEVRGSNISLKNRLAKLELALKKRDELADNLHVIDFEQLKIENQTLNERIEERHEELASLRKKTVTTVQIITHLREKLEFTQQQNTLLKADLSVLERNLIQQRDLLGQRKKERAELQAEAAKVKQQAGITGSESLNQDYAARAERLTQIRADIEFVTNDIKEKSNYAKAVFQLTSGGGDAGAGGVGQQAA